jgi:negative regulator of flagellin synthesis FlgM
MSSIGSGTGIGSGSVGEIGAVRAIGLSDARPAAQTGVAASTAPVVTTAALDAGAVPVDQDRVAMIRQAIATNSYPVVPTKIGDAMIAAGMLLRMAK